ncbi:ArnT family glycosyltransferase [Falsibacillus pallidus]|uniref:ArnT family glycosyltransferase n=1 Tax=Falsibacillus pallidus TaxID=493781 RepID=UPI003D95C73F
MFVHKLKKNQAIIYLLICYLALNIWFLIANPGSVFNQPERFGEAISTYGSRDGSLYARMAWQLIKEGVYGYNLAGSNAYVTPGQPFYLAAIFLASEWLHTNHVMLFRLANMILNISNVFLVYLIGLQLFQRRWIGVLAAFMYSTHIAYLHYFRTALTEIPSIFFFLLSIVLFIFALRSKGWVMHALFGISASVMLMFRPTPAPILLFAWAITWREMGFKQAVKIGLIWCIGPVLIMCPWVIRNLMQFGHAYLFSSHAGSPLLLGTDPFFLNEDGNLVQKARSMGMSLQDYGEKRIVDGFGSDFPLYFSWFTIGKTVWLFMDQFARPDGFGPYLQDFPKGVLGFFKWQNLFIVITSLIYALVFRKRKGVNVLGAVVLFYILLSDIFLTIPRYGLLILPVMAIISAYGMVETFIWLRVKFAKSSHENPS